MSTSTFTPHRALRALALAVGGTLAAVVVVLGSLLAAGIALFVLAGGARRKAAAPRALRAQRTRGPQARPGQSFALPGVAPALARLRR